MSQTNSDKLAATLNNEIDEDGAGDGPSSCLDTCTLVEKKKRVPGRKWNKRYLGPNQDDDMDDDDMGELRVPMKISKVHQDIETPKMMHFNFDIIDPGYDGDCEEA